ncbi:carbohydrate porin [Cupriavidus plantarum]|uniref:carbohydrate porin n=1 Tax=Cupriavidus plantarum TaxID=942865 RepID=UPI0015C8D09E|nr:carbohydrate porin [Cupriavidus plantarum]NYI02732.1 porin [Cupriavidus plantarum]
MDHRSSRNILICLALVGSTASAAEVEPPTPPQCVKYDRLNYVGSESPFPSNCESIAPELGGLRGALYDAGWNAQLLLTTGITYDLKGHDRETQVYSGQRPSSTSTGSLLLNHDLERYGLPRGSLFTLGGSLAYSTYRGDGLRQGYLSQLSARIPFYDGRLIVQFGYYGLAGQFYGTLLGNNIAASTLGPSSGLLAQTGVQGFKPSPALDIRFYSKDKRYYNHFGVARSISPDGLFADADDNRSGLQPFTKDARAVFVNEVGYRVEAGPDQRKIWLRGGAVYNTTKYARLDQPGQKSPNYGAYLVADVQLTQPDAGLPFKGWYVNLYFNQGRKDVNYLPSAFGGSIYRLAPFDSRPYDLFAFGVSKNQYSGWARQNASLAGLDHADASTNVSISYAYRVSRGIYLQSALIYTDNPTFAPRRESSLNAYATLVLVF